MSPNEFRDGLAIRYLWHPADLPACCDGCGADFTCDKKGGLVLQWHNDVTSDPTHLYSFVHQLKRLMVVLPPPPSSVTCTLFDVTPFRSVEHLRVRVICLLITCVLCKWVHVCCVHVLLYVMYAVHVVCIYVYR